MADANLSISPRRSRSSAPNGCSGAASPMCSRIPARRPTRPCLSRCSIQAPQFAGLVAGGVYPSPLPHAHVVTTTTHKTLRGPRGGLILTDDAEIGKRINSAVFPALQGGPLMHVIAAKAVALHEALRPSFKSYAKSVVENAKLLAATLFEAGL